MAKLGQVEFEAEAVGTKSSVLPLDAKLAFKGTRIGVEWEDKDGKEEEITAEQAGSLISDLCAKVPGLTPRRIVEYGIDLGWVKTRVYQGETSAFMRMENRIPTQAEVDQIALERFTASGRGGARGPRLTDNDLVNAIPGFKALDEDLGTEMEDLVKTATFLDKDKVIAKLRATFAASGLSVEQIKDLAKPKA